MTPSGGPGTAALAARAPAGGGAVAGQAVATNTAGSGLRSGATNHGGRER